MSGYSENEIVEMWAQIWGEIKPSDETEHYWEVYEDTQTTGNSLLFQNILRPVRIFCSGAYDTCQIHHVGVTSLRIIASEACLMATVECANILSPYAEYMYASEEVEPGYGWDFEAGAYSIPHSRNSLSVSASPIEASDCSSSVYMFLRRVYVCVGRS